MPEYAIVAPSGFVVSNGVVAGFTREVRFAFGFEHPKPSGAVAAGLGTRNWDRAPGYPNPNGFG